MTSTERARAINLNAGIPADMLPPADHAARCDSSCEIHGTAYRAPSSALPTGPRRAQNGY